MSKPETKAASMSDIVENAPKLHTAKQLDKAHADMMSGVTNYQQFINDNLAYGKKGHEQIAIHANHVWKQSNGDSQATGIKRMLMAFNRSGTNYTVKLKKGKKYTGKGIYEVTTRGEARGSKTRKVNIAKPRNEFVDAMSRAKLPKEAKEQIFTDLAHKLGCDYMLLKKFQKVTTTISKTESAETVATKANKKTA